MAKQLLMLLVLFYCYGVAAFVPSKLIQRSVVYKSTVDPIEIKTDTSYMPDSLLPPVRNRPAIASHRLSPKEIQRAIVDVKKFVENRLETDLNVIRVSLSKFGCAQQCNCH